MWHKKKKNKNNCVKSTNITEYALSDFSHFEINSNKEAIVEGCKGILQYDENVIKINMGKMITNFYGKNLSLKCLDSDSLVIIGTISSIEFIT